MAETELWYLSRDCREVCAPGQPAMCDDRDCCCECHSEPQCPCEIPGTGREGDCVGATCPLPPHAARALWADVEQEMARDPRPGVGGFGPRTAAQAGRGGTDVERAQAMDDRDQTALANLARDIEAENRPDLYELLAERYRQPRRGAA